MTPSVRQFAPCPHCGSARPALGGRIADCANPRCVAASRRRPGRIIGDLTDAQVNKFWAKVQQSEDCWEWTGERNRDGYGQFYAGQTYLAHRVAWHLANGSVPSGAFVLHACDNPACVRADHLRLGTNRDNMLDMVSRGRQPRHIRPFTVCRRGLHPMTYDNVYRRRNGRQTCRACRRANSAARRLTTRPSVTSSATVASQPMRSMAGNPSSAAPDDAPGLSAFPRPGLPRRRDRLSGTSPSRT